MKVMRTAAMATVLLLGSADLAIAQENDGDDYGDIDMGNPWLMCSKANIAEAKTKAQAFFNKPLAGSTVLSDMFTDMFDLMSHPGYGYCNEVAKVAITKKEVEVTFSGDVGCAHEWGTDAFFADPCCNDLHEKCCVAKDITEKIEVLDKIDDELVNECYTADAMKIQLLAYLNFEKEAMQKGAEDLGVDFDNLGVVFEKNFGFFSTCMMAIQPIECKSDADCLSNTCSKSKRCVFTPESTTRAWGKCTLLHMPKPALKIFMKRINVTAITGEVSASNKDALDKFQTAFKAAFEDKGCYGPSAWSHQATSEWVEDPSSEEGWTEVLIPANQVGCLTDMHCSVDPWWKTTNATCEPDSTKLTVCTKCWSDNDCTTTTVVPSCTASPSSPYAYAMDEATCATLNTTLGTQAYVRPKFDAWGNLHGCLIQPIGFSAVRDLRNITRDQCFFETGSLAGRICHYGAGGLCAKEACIIKSKDTVQKCTGTTAPPVTSTKSPTRVTTLAPTTAGPTPAGTLAPTKSGASDYLWDINSGTCYYEQYYGSASSIEQSCTNLKAARPQEDIEYHAGRTYDAGKYADETSCTTTPQCNVGWDRWSTEAECTATGECDVPCIPANLDDGFGNCDKATCEATGICEADDQVFYEQCSRWEYNSSIACGVCLKPLKPEQWDCEEAGYYWTPLGCVNRALSGVNNSAVTCTAGHKFVNRTTDKAGCEALAQTCQEPFMPEDLMNPKSAAECTKCGGTVKPWFKWKTGTFTAGVWGAPSPSEVKWKTQEWTSENLWGTFFSNFKFQQAVMATVEELIATDIRNSVRAQVLWKLDFFEDMNCDCGSKNKDCFKDSRAPSEVKKCPQGSASCGAVTNIVSDDPAATTQTSVKLAGSVVATSATQSALARHKGTLKSSSPYAIVKDAGDNFVGQILGNGYGMNYTGTGKFSALVCLATNPDIKIDKLNFPVFDVADSDKAGNVGVPLGMILELAANKICFTCTNNGVYYPIARKLNIVTRPPTNWGDTYPPTKEPTAVTNKYSPKFSAAPSSLNPSTLAVVLALLLALLF